MSVTPIPVTRRVWLPSLVLIVTWIAFVANPSTARADFITYSATGSDTDGPLSATASFTTGAGTLSIMLTNNQHDIVASGQAISGISFTLSTPPSGTITGAGDSGQLINITPGKMSGGVVTPTSGNPDRWESPGHITQSGSTGEIITLGGSQPSEMILGPPSSDGNYDNMNNGTASNFSPWVETTGTFNLNIPGITSNTRITAVTFFFGTGPDKSLVGTAIPEPSTLALVIAGVSVMGLMGFFRVRQRRALALA